MTTAFSWTLSLLSVSSVFSVWGRKETPIPAQQFHKIDEWRLLAYICRMPQAEWYLSIWQQIDALDKRLFMQLNSGWTNGFFDTILPYFRDPSFWAPLYMLMISFMLLNFGKKGFLWSITLLCTLAITDMVGHRVFKEGFERLRPCSDPEFLRYVRLLVKQCSGGFSFTSNHAANHFGIATFVSITMYPTFKKWIYLFYAWAFFVGYAQIYVGVHYPLDVLGGGLLGIMAGLLTATIFTSKAGTINLAA